MAIDKIDIKEEGEKQLYDKDWFNREFENSFVDLNKKVERPETLISIGSHSYGGNVYPTTIMSAGEFSVITAPSKSKKSFIKSFFSAVYAGGNTEKFFPEIKGHRKEDVYIVDCDTEQSKYYSHFTFQRTQKISGHPYKYYLPFKLRHLTPEQRVAFIDHLLKHPKYKGKVKLVFIDGIADLIDDTNDLVMSNYIAGKLLQWTDVLNIHVNVIIHNVYGSKKPTGHLGSAVVKKAETVIQLEQADENDDLREIIKVTNPYSRGRSFDPFFFKINKSDSLPYECDEMGNIIGINEDFRNQFVPEKKIKPATPQEAFEEPEDNNDVPF